MRIALAGATGQTGRRVLDLALQRGHEVTALVRRPDALGPAREGLTVVTTQVADDGHGLAEALEGHETVISALGSALFGPESRNKIMAAAHRNLVTAAGTAGVSRFTSMFAYGSGDTRAHAPAGIRLLGRTLLRSDFADIDRAVRTLQGSSLRWAIAYFGSLADSGATGRWVATRKLVRPARYRISRADVADALLALSEDAQEASGSYVLSGAPA